MLPGAALLLSLLTPNALASDGPYMWGVGGFGGTIVLPGRYPAKLPHLEAGSIHGDVVMGVHGVLYINPDYRLGTHFSYGLARDYDSMAWTAEFERILVRGGGVHVFFGGGFGFGSYRFLGVDEEMLKVPTYEVRAQAGAMLKQSTTAEELSIFVKQPFNGNPTWTDAAGAQSDSKGGNLVHVGLELTVYYGGFRAD